MRKSQTSIDRRYNEADAILKGFSAVNFQKYNTDSYSYGYLKELLTSTLAKNVSEEVFKDIMDQLREATIKNFVGE